MKILITGGAGFIGSHIAEYLVDNRYEVRVLDNLSTGKIENILPIIDKIEFVNGDIRDINMCRIAVNGVDVVCHQAAIGSVPRSIDDPIFTHDNNVNGTINMLYTCKDLGVKRFIYASSSSVYGDNVELPKIEENTGHPLSPYAITKSVSEMYARVFTELYDMECIGLRYFNVFGPRQDPEGQYAAVIPRFITDIMNNERPIINGNGECSRDFTYVDNIVLANMTAILTENYDAFGEVYNIACGKKITINELYDHIATELNSNISPLYGPERDGDIQHSNANIDKANIILGYKPIVSCIDGIKNTCKWYMENIDT